MLCDGYEGRLVRFFLKGEVGNGDLQTPSVPTNIPNTSASLAF